MSLHAGNHGPSPLSSGRSSPIPRRRIEDDPTKKDPKYKRFSASIDRALALFEGHSLQEWADYISFLGRLLKTLQSHPSLPLIPSKHIVAQRLAQCLNPRLPAGVHQKAIQLYSEIFRLIGRDGLAADLALWTPGLTPVLSYASLNTKPPYLELLERYYLPLGTAIRPALKSIVLALLPGIDEEGGEYFDRTLELIDRFRKGVEDDAYFWQCVMLATITSPGRRQGALVFLSRRLPKLGDTNAMGPEEGQSEEERKREIDALLDPEPGLLVRALCAGLGDEQLLVQRGFLDLLVTNVPLSSDVIRNRVSKPDLQLLVSSAAGVVLRKEMSLNRRLWAWFLGAEEAKALEYFRAYGAQPLIGGMLEMLQQDDNATPAERARPYRICLSFMDRWEVGSEVVPEVFSSAIERLQTYEKCAGSTEQYAEAFNSASMFFDGVEASLIWKQILDKVDTAFKTGDTANLETVRFIVRSFNVQEEEMVMVHAPITVLAILVQLEKLKSANPGLRKGAFILAEDIWDLIPEAAFRKAKPVAFVTDIEDDILKSIQNFYTKQTSRAGNGANLVPLLPSMEMARRIFDAFANLAREAFETRSPDITIQSRLFIKIVHKIPRIEESQNLVALVDSCMKRVEDAPVPFGALQGVAGIVTVLHIKQYLRKRELDGLVAPTVSELWNYLSPDLPKFHVESVKALWNLQRALGDRSIEAAISAAMIKNDIGGTYSTRDADQGRRFTVLWMHSVNSIAGNAYHMMLTRPLFLLLDSLADEEVEMSVFTRGWLQNLPSLNRLFWIFVAKLLELDFLKDPGKRDSDAAPLKRPVFQDDDDLELATYYFRTLANILKNATEGVMATLASELVVNGDEFRRRALFEKGYGDEDMSLQMFFAQASLRAVEGDPPNQRPKELQRVSKLHKVSLNVLHHLLLSSHSKGLADMALEEIMTARLVSIMKTPATYIQVSLLDVLHAALKLSVERPTSHLGHLRVNRENIAARAIARLSVSTGGEAEKPANPPPQFTPPQQLLKCLLGGFSNASSRPVLESWMFFLAECLPLLEDVIFQMLIPLVECLCEQIKKTFQSLQTLFREHGKTTIPESAGRSPESTLVALLSGLEEILAAAHRQLLIEEHTAARTKSPDATATASGFFGSMVSGVFSVEGPQSRTAAANNRLTVLLCFQDTVKLCYSIWSWGDVATTGAELDPVSRESWQHTSLKMKARSRKILEHMFAAETLECLETLIELWPGRLAPYGERTHAGSSIFKLVNVLDGSRPKHTIPAIFHAIYSRSNASALDVSLRSTLTAELSDMDVVVFLVEYARSLEDDAMDEIWAECMMFLRDVLANPFPHRQTLPSLLGFAAIIGEKVDNTNFGEQRRMRKELADLFQRLLTVTFTTAPVGQRTLEPPAPTASVSTPSSPITTTSTGRPFPRRTQPDDIIPIIASALPSLRAVLLEPDRVLTACTTISASLITPTFRAKSFPANISPIFLSLILSLTKITNTVKAWKSAISDALNDPRFFSTSANLVDSHWVPIIRQYLTSDRDYLPGLLSRLTPPTSAGVLFGVGANSARLEADRKTQLNLKRIALAIYAADMDAFLPVLSDVEDKIVELLHATAVSSPSSATRVEIYLLLRVLVLRVSPVHLSGLWPVLSAELQNALMALWPGESEAKDNWNDQSVLAACKLIDTLLVLAPDEWQLLEWLFVTDTSEAVWATSSSSVSNNTALVDTLKTQIPASSSVTNERDDEDEKVKNRWGRRMWFRCGEGRDETGKGDVIEKWVAPWLRAVSAESYEGTYRMGRSDVKGCEEAVVRDLFEEVN